MEDNDPGKTAILTSTIMAVMLVLGAKWYINNYWEKRMERDWQDAVLHSLQEIEARCPTVENCCPKLEVY